MRISDSDQRIIWRADAGRRTPKSAGAWRWYRVSHQNVGAVTNARGSFGRRNMSKDHYTIHDGLCLGRPELPVVDKTHFSRTGWGKRVLDKCEVALAFEELPDFAGWDIKLLTEIVPLQMM